MMVSAQNCPIKADAEKVVELGGETLKYLRRLRINMRKCQDCSDNINCPIQAEFNAAVDQVIQELNEEWGLI
jgi:hypothetical protein